MKSAVYRLERLVALSQALNELDDLGEILRVVARTACDLFNGEVAMISRLNPLTRDTVKTVVREGYAVDEKRYRVAKNQISGWILKNQQSLLSTAFQADPRFANLKLRGVVVKTALGVPIRSGGVLLGSLVILNRRDARAFEENDLRLLENIMPVFAPHLRNSPQSQGLFHGSPPAPGLLEKYGAEGLLGRSPAFISLLQSIEAAARCDVRVVLEGPSGTGKELIARAIHKFSRRQAAPFVAVDCGAIPRQLLESEFFGHVKGAFTGAERDREGIIREADGGTLFLDEISNLPMDMQAKFMRVLQQQEIRPVGSNKTQRVNVRIIAASSASLKQLVDEGAFRDDLYYRLQVYPIFVPSLNARAQDIPLLGQHFLQAFCASQRKKILGFDEDVLDFMKRRPWRGNIRELENFIERLVTLAPPGTEFIHRSLLPEELQREMKRVRRKLEHPLVGKSLAENVNDLERKLIEDALLRHDGNQSKAARALKIAVQTLRYKMNKLGIASLK